MLNPKIKKTTDSDNSKQSGAGAEVTALAESLQAYTCATRQFLGKDLIDIAQVTQKTIGDADCDRTLKQCLAGLDENWLSSVITTANQIFSDVPGAKIGKKYTFHRGGSFVNSIYDEWRRMKDGSGITGDDKWNPADIWMVKKTFKLQTGWPSLRDYNSFIYDEFSNKNLIGISLKKLAPGGSAHPKIFNAGKPLTAKFTGIKLGPNMFDSKDIYIQFDSEGKAGEIQLRNFSSRPEPSSWQGEIKGKTAAGGKIGGGIIFAGAVDTGIQKSKLTFPKEVPVNKPSEVDFKKFATMFKGLSKSKDSIDSLIIQAKAGHRKDKTWWMSKYIGIDLVHTMLENKKMDALCSYMFQYASSATKNSSIFIKYS
jgi:hypothetical protein